MQQGQAAAASQQQHQRLFLAALLWSHSTIRRVPAVEVQLLLLLQQRQPTCFHLLAGLLSCHLGLWILLPALLLRQRTAARMVQQCRQLVLLPAGPMCFGMLAAATRAAIAAAVPRLGSTLRQVDLGVSWAAVRLSTRSQPARRVLLCSPCRAAWLLQGQLLQQWQQQLLVLTRLSLQQEQLASVESSSSGRLGLIQPQGLQVWLRTAALAYCRQAHASRVMLQVC